MKQIDIESLKKRETNTMVGSCVGYRVEEKSYSIMDLIENDELKSKVLFIAKDQDGEILSSDGIQFTTDGQMIYTASSFFSVAIKVVKCDGKDMTILQFIDKSSTIMHDRILQQKNILEKVHDCIQYKMKSPLNSILALNIKQNALLKELE